jgi:hypothetical protein
MVVHGIAIDMLACAVGYCHPLGRGGTVRKEKTGMPWDIRNLPWRTKGESAILGMSDYVPAIRAGHRSGRKWAIPAGQLGKDPRRS